MPHVPTRNLAFGVPLRRRERMVFNTLYVSRRCPGPPRGIRYTSRRLCSPGPRPGGSDKEEPEAQGPSIIRRACNARGAMALEIMRVGFWGRKIFVVASRWGVGVCKKFQKPAGFFLECNACDSAKVSRAPLVAGPKTGASGRKSGRHGTLCVSPSPGPGTTLTRPAFADAPAGLPLPGGEGQRPHPEGEGFCGERCCACHAPESQI